MGPDDEEELPVDVLGNRLDSLLQEHFMPPLSATEIGKRAPELDRQVNKLFSGKNIKYAQIKDVAYHMFLSSIANAPRGKAAEDRRAYALELFARYFYERLSHSGRPTPAEIALDLCGLTSESYGLPLGFNSAPPGFYSYIEDYALTHDPVLILGETGTGKELLAKAVHYLSSRRTGPFVPVNCGGLNEETLLSELFGHAKGAFTGATGDKQGAFKLADGGTLFLDEVGDMPVKAQVGVLRALNDGMIQRLGETGKNIPVNVRVVAATNKNLKEAIKDRSFREDLFYRLNVFPVELLPLRDYRRDQRQVFIRGMLKLVVEETGASDEIMKLSDLDYVHHGLVRLDGLVHYTMDEQPPPDYIPHEGWLGFREPDESIYDAPEGSLIVPETYAKEYTLRRLPESKEILDSATLSKAAMEALIDYPYPGNWRELRAILKRAFVHASKGKIELQHLPPEVRGVGVPKHVESQSEQWLNMPYREFEQTVNDLWRQRLEKALKGARGNVSEAARQCGIAMHRFRALMTKHGAAYIGDKGRAK